MMRWNVALAGMALLAGLAAGAGVAPASAADEAPVEGRFRDMIFVQPRGAVPDTPFKGPGGETVRLGDYAGEFVVLNFWATWCVPCVKEMPSLDRLQATLADEPFRVVAVSLDRGGRPKIEQFYERHGIERLGAYPDPLGNLRDAMQVSVLPTTVLIGRDGREIARLYGDAEWDSDEALAMIRYYLKESP
jgi:thiol-disulfide isomerase/thioredoxin